MVTVLSPAKIIRLDFCFFSHESEFLADLKGLDCVKVYSLHAFIQMLDLKSECIQGW